jgi:hypothetical protein
MTIWRIRIAFLIPKATNTHKICNTFCFYMVTVVSRTSRLRVTSYLQSRSYWHVNFLRCGDVEWPLFRLTFPDYSQNLNPPLRQKNEVSLRSSSLSMGCRRAKELSCSWLLVCTVKVTVVGHRAALSSAPADMALPAVLETKIGLQPNRN